MNNRHPSRSNIDPQTAAIAANLTALAVCLAHAAKSSAEARRLILRGERNTAMGTIADLQGILDDARALYHASVALHRTKH